MGATLMDLNGDTHTPQPAEEKMHKKDRKSRSDGDSKRHTRNTNALAKQTKRNEKKPKS